MAVGGMVLLTHLSLNVQGERTAYGAFHRIKDTYVRVRGHLPVAVPTIVADPGDLCFLDFWMNPLGLERTRMMAFSAYDACDDIPPNFGTTKQPRFAGFKECNHA